MEREGIDTDGGRLDHRDPSVVEDLGSHTDVGRGVGSVLSRTWSQGRW